MKIAFIVNQFPAISETFILRQITGLLDRGHEVDIFAYSPGKDPVRHPDVEKYGLLRRTYYLTACGSSEIRILRLVKRIRLLATNFHKNPIVIFKTLNVLNFGKQAVLLQVFCQIIPFLDKGPYDIVHCQFGYLGELGLLLRGTGLSGSKVVTSFRGYDISSYVRTRGDGIYNDLFERGDLFLCVSEHIREKLIKLGCDPRKILVHRSGAEVKKSALLPNVTRKNGKIRILTIARLVEKKGVEYGIQAVAKTLKECRDVEYDIVGEGSLRGRLQSLIDELRVGDKIKLLGWKTQGEIAELLKTSDVLLAPSVTTKVGDEEGIPGVIMEAFAEGLPVVSTYHAGIPELVKDGVSGFLVPERDVDALARRLQRLVEDSELRFAMGRSGCEFVQEHFDIQKLNDRLVEIYQQLLDGESTHIAGQSYISPGTALPLN